jgi:hypothetical protein
MNAMLLWEAACQAELPGQCRNLLVEQADSSPFTSYNLIAVSLRYAICHLTDHPSGEVTPDRMYVIDPRELLRINVLPVRHRGLTKRRSKWQHGLLLYSHPKKPLSDLEIWGGGEPDTSLSIVPLSSVPALGEWKSVHLGRHRGYEQCISDIAYHVACHSQ